MSKLFEINHPLLQHKLTSLRKKETGTKEFRELVSEIATLLCYAATHDLPLVAEEIETPVAKATCPVIKQEDVTIVPVLRAGLGMVEGVLAVLPKIRVGHVGMRRNEETLVPEEYYCNLPSNLADGLVLVLDPMLATGGSAIATIDLLKKQGAKKIKFLNILAAPEGVSAMEKQHPDVEIYCVTVDEKLNEKGYIVPGLGDAGDRIFGTV